MLSGIHDYDAVILSGQQYYADNSYYQSEAIISNREQTQILAQDQEATTSNHANKVNILYTATDSKTEIKTNADILLDIKKQIAPKPKCVPIAGEILVCVDDDIDTKYRISPEQSLREIPLNQRSWADISDRLQNNAANNRQGAYSDTGHSAALNVAPRIAREFCDEGLDAARDANATARAIAKISQNQTSSPPKRRKGPCEP